MAGYTFKQMLFFYARNKKSTTRRPLRNVRDALVRMNGAVNYYVWGNKIATLLPRKRILTVSSAGWETKLTKDRLNRLLPKGYITQKKFKWYYVVNNRTIPFRGSLRIKL